MDYLRRKIGLLTLLLSLLLSSLLFSEDAQPPNISMDQLGTAIHTTLDASIQQSKSLTESLKKQSDRVEQLQTDLNELTTCLDNTNKQLETSETNLIASETKSKAKTRIIVVETILIALHILGFIAMMILMSKGIKLPYIVAGAI